MQQLTSASGARHLTGVEVELHVTWRELSQERNEMLLKSIPASIEEVDNVIIVMIDNLFCFASNNSSCTSFWWCVSVEQNNEHKYPMTTIRYPIVPLHFFLLVPLHFCLLVCVLVLFVIFSFRE